MREGFEYGNKQNEALQTDLDKTNWELRQIKDETQRDRMEARKTATRKESCQFRGEKIDQSRNNLELESLSSDLLAEIPSDPESIDTDSDSDDDNIFVPLTSSNKIQIYTDSDSYVESVTKPFISSKKVRILSQIIVTTLNLVNSGTTACSPGRQPSDDEDSVSTVLPKSSTPDVESSNYDSEDNVPLAQLQKENPSREYQSIDEGMICSKERSSLKQYMLFKPIKRGYKVWMKADINGYVNEFQIYTGKIDNLKTETGLAERVIRLDNISYCCGTVRVHRKSLPSDISEDKILRRGETDWRQATSEILYTKWKDERCISFLSNYHNPDELTNVNRRQKNGFLQVIPCLSVVKDYNKFMSGVDKADMLKSLYEINRKSKKWWHKIFFHFVDVSVANSYIIFKNRCRGPTLTLKEFRLSVVDGLLGTRNNLVNLKKHVPPEV
ncbi:hypothetical protein ILUMI_26033 [Ignelater luminosus]|uniref:PiggyBac transposable element-derived protein domain-containing protein n=1 Tax=Ignelater luminosus TaxID=2038154 RepID=A0A8K0C6E5_IGNLU|nr:hypothetical protein ILUMI_26033 [Ignelater luminosus]